MEVTTIKEPADRPCDFCSVTMNKSKYYDRIETNYTCPCGRVSCQECSGCWCNQCYRYICEDCASQPGCCVCDGWDDHNSCCRKCIFPDNNDSYYFYCNNHFPRTFH